MKRCVCAVMVCCMTVFVFDSLAEDVPRVIYEYPTQDDVITIHTTEGYCTVLEFPEKPLMVAVGDSSLFKIEIPKNAKTVLIKPIALDGESNLFVFTTTRRFNYHLLIGDVKSLNYVVDVKNNDSLQTKTKNEVLINDLLKTVRNYRVLVSLGTINKNLVTQKQIFSQQQDENLTIKIIEGFTYKNPHYLMIHCIVQNKKDTPLIIDERNTFLYVNENKFRPAFITFDTQMISGMKETDGWIIVKNSYLSLDNPFSLQIGTQRK